MKQWTKESMNGWINERIHERINEQINERINEWTNERTNERTNEQTNERTNGRTDWIAKALALPRFLPSWFSYHHSTHPSPFSSTFPGTDGVIAQEGRVVEKVLNSIPNLALFSPSFASAFPCPNGVVAQERGVVEEVLVFGSIVRNVVIENRVGRFVDRIQRSVIKPKWKDINGCAALVNLKFSSWLVDTVLARASIVINDIVIDIQVFELVMLTIW